MSGLKSENLAFLRKEAKILFKRLTFRERTRMGSYKPLFEEMKVAWKAGHTIEIDNKDIKTKCNECGSLLGSCEHEIVMGGV